MKKYNNIYIVNGSIIIVEHNEYELVKTILCKIEKNVMSEPAKVSCTIVHCTEVNQADANSFSTDV